MLRGIDTYDFGTILVFREILSGTIEKLLYLLVPPVEAAEEDPAANTDDLLEDLDTVPPLF